MDRAYVFIYLPGDTRAVPAGLFEHLPDVGAGRFRYGRRYRQRPAAMAVDPVALPLVLPERETTLNGGMFGAIRDAAPDYWGRLVVAAQLRTDPSALNEVDLLLWSNATRVGNLDFRTSPDAEEPEAAVPQFAQLQDLLTAADRLQAGEDVAPHFIKLLRQGSSLGGARPKCTVAHGNALWLAKFPCRDERVNLPRIEYACMRLAGKCGIRIPELNVVRVGAADVLMVKRFDRARHREGWLRSGFVSALSLAEWDERDRMSWSYPALAERMRQHCNRPDMEELFRRMLFNIMVRNTDDHPRNHGFLIRSDGIRLSPAYDLVPSLTLPGVGTEFNLAMTVGEQGRLATVQNALSRAAAFGLKPSAALEVVEELRGTIAGWAADFLADGVDEETVEALRPSFAACR